MIDEAKQVAADVRSEGLTLLTDLYQLTMAQGYFEEGKHNDLACFYMFFRDMPFEGGYAVAAGIDQLMDLVEGFHFDQDDIDYLAGLPAPGGGLLFKQPFLDYLRELVLTVDIDTVREGDLVFTREPLVRVTGPILQCQLLETALLNCVNFQTLVATKAARICSVAKGAVAEFGLRRAQGPDGGVSASRAAYIGGCASTSNVLAGKLFDIPVSGTHAHSWVMSFDSELEAFRAYAKTSPSNCVLLVDTYDVERGVRNAITVGREMRARGEKLAGIRIDSGDLAWLSKKARKMLDEAGFPDVKIVASNNLDEYTIASLNEQDACIDSYGVGTYMATCYDQPALGGVYKLSALFDDATGTWVPKVKATETAAKATIPGVLGVRRYVRPDGSISGDMIYDINQEPSGSAIIIDPLDSTRRKNLSRREYFQLLTPLVRGGKLVREREHVRVARERCLKNIAALDPSVARLLRPHNIPVGIESGLFARREDLLLEAKGFKSASFLANQDRALLLVDIQNDFCPGGALEVAEGDQVVPVANQLIALFKANRLPVIATCDYHPQGHVSFASSHEGCKVGDVIDAGGVQQYLWPDHCVQGTTGAQLHPDLNVKDVTSIVYKGTKPDVDSYSAFFDNAHGSEQTTGFLRDLKVKELVVCGLATDYCVKYSVLDALSLGFQVTLVTSGCRAVNVKPEDEQLAIQEMEAAGCRICEGIDEL
ncbi:MAG: nicotinate phosphoribosyltransferase [Coriobacteriales bacterium]|nr:nicotinate phosphoribosyltransferase [Coriobacteriales bacterium]